MTCSMSTRQAWAHQRQGVVFNECRCSLHPSQFSPLSLSHPSQFSSLSTRCSPPSSAVDSLLAPLKEALRDALAATEKGDTASGAKAAREASKSKGGPPKAAKDAGALAEGVVHALLGKNPPAGGQGAAGPSRTGGGKRQAGGSGRGRGRGRGRGDGEGERDGGDSGRAPAKRQKRQDAAPASVGGAPVAVATATAPAVPATVTATATAMAGAPATRMATDGRKEVMRMQEWVNASVSCLNGGDLAGAIQWRNTLVSRLHAVASFLDRPTVANITGIVQQLDQHLSSAVARKR